MHANDKPSDSVRVWDPVVRIGHWVIVAAFFTAYFSGDEFQGTHLWAGYVVAGVVSVRIIWGMIGTRHARFSSFVTGPGAVLRYLRGLVSGKAERHIGHNPAGGAMIIALLFSLAGTTISGMALLAAEEGRGPLAGLAASAPAPAAPHRPAAGERYEGDDDDGEFGGHGGESAEELLEEAHSAFTYLTLGLIALHIFGVLASSLAHRENLVRAMITGRKRANA